MTVIDALVPKLTLLLDMLLARIGLGDAAAPSVGPEVIDTIGALLVTSCFGKRRTHYGCVVCTEQRTC